MNKRILIFSTAYFPLVGGAEVAMKEITDRITDIRFDLICAKIRPGLSSNEQIGNVTVHRVGIGHPLDKFLLPVTGTIKSFFLEKPDVVWSLMASFGGFTALVYTWFRPKAKLLLTLQEGDPLEHYDRRAGSFQFLHRMIFRRADAVQAISRFLADWGVNMGFQGTPEVVPNGVDLTRFTDPGSKTMGRTDVRLQYGFTESDVVLVTASRLSHKNGVDDLIHALTHLPPSSKALIAGEGEDAQKVKALVTEHHLEDRVVFAGSVSHRDLPAVLASGDIFIRASRSEGLGNAFLEAMAVGLPVIGTPVGGIPDFLVDGETGVFCQPNDPVSIATAVQRITTDPSLRERLIKNGERLVRQKYGWEGIAARMGEMLRSLDRNPRRKSSGVAFRLFVLVGVMATGAVFIYVGTRAADLYPMYVHANVRSGVQIVMQEMRDRAGLGLSKFRIQSVHCENDACELRVTVRERLLPPRHEEHAFAIHFQPDTPGTYEIHGE